MTRSPVELLWTAKNMLCKPADNPRPDLGAELGGGGEEEDGVDHELAARKYFIEKERRRQIISFLPKTIQCNRGIRRSEMPF